MSVLPARLAESGFELREFVRSSRRASNVIEREQVDVRRTIVWIAVYSVLWSFAGCGGDDSDGEHLPMQPATVQELKPTCQSISDRAGCESRL